MSVLLFAPDFASAAANAQPMALPYWSAIPFVLLLLCIALLPIIAGHWWHANRNKAIVAAVLAVPIVIYLLAIGPNTGGQSVERLLHGLEEYASFIILLTALYTISGGIVLRGDFPAHPMTNTVLLALGAVLANVIGTTGASMLLIRPLLRLNADRTHLKHLPIFFIFIVSNTAGLLTPLGDPPLFLGFLGGVDFFWTMRLWPQWLVVNGMLLTIFFFWDRRAYRREPPKNIAADEAGHKPVRLEGSIVNGLLLAGTIYAVLLQSPQAAAALGLPQLKKPWGEIVMLGCAVLSLLLTRRALRHVNEFAWGPMVEVAVLFVGIFITMAPALAILAVEGDKLGLRETWKYFWATGLLSSFLDNAPTYVSFATLAAGQHDFNWLSINRPAILEAISCGAVFMGAVTYIGNGPNFMVKAIAESRGYPMPSFAGYVLWSGLILLPVFGIVTAVFFLNG